MLKKYFWIFLFCLFILFSDVMLSLADTTVGGIISSDTTWTLAGSPYNVTSTVQVYGTSTTPATLTIQPGVVVKFASGVGLQIGNGTSQGALIAQGTASDRITFTRSATSGTWNGVTFQAGTVNATTDLENVDIQYSSGVTITSASPTIRNSTITNVTGYGLNLSSASPIIDTVTITSTGSYGIYLSSSSPTITNSTITNNGTYGIYLNYSSPTITGGSLTNTSTTGYGIYGSGSPVITNYTVSSANSVGIYGLYLSTTTSAFSITNSTISNGLYIGSTGITPTISGNTFTNLDNSPLHAGANIIAQIIAYNTLTGQTSAGRVEVIGEQVSQNTTWSQLVAPYVVVSGIVSVYNTTTTPSTLTIAPGTVVKFASGAGLQIGNGTSKGALVAQGTASNRITFTRSATSGTWGSVSFQAGTVNTTTDLENVDIQYSTGVTITSSSPTIRNSTITNVIGYGLNLSSANPIIDTVTITNNGTYGIYLNSSSPTITGGSLTNLNATGSGIYGSGSPIISNYTVSIVNSSGIYGLYLSTTTSALSVTNSTISNGLYIGSTAINPTITGNTFTNLDNSPLHAGANIIDQIIANNTLTGQTSAGRVEVVGEQVSQNTTWSQLVAPYVVVSGTVSVYNTTTTPSTLTIAPGTVVKFASGTGLQIGNGASKGALVAQGTASSRITFTRNATSGAWGSVSFQAGTVNATTDLENVDIQYSTGVSITSASPTIRNSTITNVTGYGLNLSSASPIIDTVTITNNGTYGIYLTSSSSPTITGGSLTNTSTTGSGIYGSGSPIISNYTVSSANSVGIYGLYLSTTTSALSVTNSTISNGLYIGSTAINPTITGNTFTNLDNSPIHVGANIIAQVIANNTLTGLSSAGRVEVVGEQISQNTTWNQLAAPYWVVSGTVSVYNTTTTPSTLTIAPGTVVKFAANTGLQIGNGTSQGALIAKGTTTARITFTRSGTSGTWGTIAFQDGTVDTTTVIENTDIQYSSGVSITSASPTIRTSTITDVTGYGLNLSSANPTVENVTITNNGSYGISLSSSSPIITGGSLTNTNTTGYGIYGSGSPVISDYNVSIVNSAGKYGLYLSSPTSTFSVTNSTISNGLYIGSTGITPTITGNTFTNLDNSPIHVGANIIAQVIANNTLTGQSSAGRVEVVGEQVSQNATWSQLVAPYVVVSGTVSVYNTTTTPSTLTIAPGTMVKFASGAGLQIGYNNSQGALIAQGTASNRITFTRSAASGTWGSVSFQAGAVNATTDLENVDIQYSTGITITSSSPTIRNSTITNVIGYGLNLSSANPIIDTVTITNTGSYGIYLSSSSPTITGGSLTNSNATGSGIYGSGSPVISNYTVSSANSIGIYGLYLSTTTSALTVTNSTVGNGLYIGSTAITPTITGNTFTNLDNSPLHAGANIIAQIIANNTLTGQSSAGRVEVVGEQVSQNATWNQLVAPYVVISGTVSVYNTTTPSSLTIAPGTVVKFASGAGLQIGNGTSKGALVAQGTASNRITFTRSATSGTWGSVSFHAGTVNATTDLENVDIQYNTGVTIISSSPTIRNSTITNVTGYGLNLSSASPIIDTVTITNNGTYGMFLSSSSPVITGGSLTNSYTGGYGLYLSSSNPTINNVTIINNGTYGIYLSSSSPTITGGSLTNTSTTGSGIYGNGSPIISNYTVSSANSIGIYGLYLSTTTSALSVTNSTISNGLYIGSTAIVPTITGNTFTNLDNSSLHAGANIIGQITANNTLIGLSSAGRIEVVGELVSQNATWSQLVAPYVVVSGTVSVYNTTTTPSILTIAPGTVVKFASGTGFQIGSGSYGGVLIADGSSSPILFTSSKPIPVPGDWAGITMNGSGASASILTGVIVEYGGTGGYYYNANLYLSSSSPIIRSCTIRNSAGSGIYLTSAANSPLIQNSAIYGNKWGIYASSSNPSIVNSTIYGNSTAGVWNATTSSTVDARDNWWGASAGPYHASNPTGTGNAVSDAALFNPWLGQSPTSGLSFTSAKVTPLSFNANGGGLTFSATLSATANWTITITDSTSNVINTFTGSGSTISQQWAGENSLAAKVADGSYSYQIQAVNTTTQATASPLVGSVTVLSQLPIAILTVPADNQVYSGGSVINVTGTASDPVALTSYTLDYGAGNNPTSWTVLKNGTTPVQNALIAPWDLSTATGGVYTLRLTATDKAGYSTATTARIRLLWIQNATVSETYISPNGDGIKDSTLVSASASYPVNWVVTFANTGGTVVRTFNSTGNAFAQTWDGRDAGGNLVSDGVYTYKITALDVETLISATPKTGTITVDVTPPLAVITTPSSAASLTNTVSIVGTAADQNLDSYRVEYGPATGAGPWTILTSGTMPVTAGTLATWITNNLSNAILLQNGDYQLRLTVSDKAGNSSGFAILVTVNNLLLTNVSASSHTIDTNSAQTTSIQFDINAPAALTLRIVPEKLGPSGSAVYQTSQICPTAGSYSFTWDGKDSTGKAAPDEAYLYVLDASDGTRTGGYSPPAPIGTGSVTCSQGTYNPYKNEPLTVTYSPSQPGRVNLNISWGAQNFKVMDGVAHVSGNYTYNWDGRNPTNKILADGAVASCAIAALLPENHIITTGDTPKVTWVKTDPYQMSLSYGQFSRIKYTVSQQASVTLKLLSPSGASAILINNLPQSAGSYELEWTAADATDVTGKKFLFSEEGDYMVWIQVVKPVTGTSSVTKGNLKINY